MRGELSRPSRLSRAGLGRALIAVALLATLAAGLGIGVRGLFGAHVAVDEEQYLLTAISLAEDGSLDISDEIAEQRWRAFADVAPAIETSVLPDGQQVSPHDPLLPLLLAAPAGVGGYVGAKLFLAMLAGLAAALALWLAVRRFGVRWRTAAVGVAIASASAPLAVYGQQLYPELVAALVVLVAVTALTAPAGPAAPAGSTLPSQLARRAAIGDLALLVVAVAALPWLSVKYAPVAVVLAGLGAVRWWRLGQRRLVLGGAAGLAGLGLAYLGVHRAVWGGWTAYASGDHFAQTGEFAVMGVDPHLGERTLRLAGLLLDREFGLVPWQPAWLLVVPAAAALLAWRRRTAMTMGTADGRLPDWAVLLLPLAAGWLVATYPALTMHGYWSPGRQLVVVLLLALLAVLIWVDRGPPWLRAVAGALGLAGVVGYAVLLGQGYAGVTTWAVHFVDADAPAYRLLYPALTVYRGELHAGHVAGFAVLAGLGVLAWWDARRRTPAVPSPPAGTGLPAAQHGPPLGARR